YEPSQIAIKNLLIGCDGIGKYTMPPDAWFIQFLRPLGLSTPLKDLEGKGLQDFLTKRSKLKNL
ncbi:hypothetical protein PAXRUDRAFT_136181, partial [Paxillus rubicundulus Ve08.2h10]